MTPDDARISGSKRVTLRVAHLTPAYFSPDSVIGGGERYVDYVIRALAGAAGDEFVQSIVSLGREDRFFLRGGIPVRVLQNESPSPNFLDGVSADLWRELVEFDILHIHQSLSVFGAYCTAVGRALRKTLILTDHGGGESPLMLAGGGIALADGVVSVSNYARSLVAPSYSGPHAVLIGPVDTEAFTPGRCVRQPRTAICVARIMPHKGIDRILRALPPGLHLRVVGKVHDERYHGLLLDLAQGRDVEFIHDADDAMLLELYRTSSLFLQGSTTRDIYGTTIRKPELMGLTTLEAMACGLPVIVSDAASLPELAPDPRFGRVFSDEADLRGMLEDFLLGLWPGPGAAELARAHVVARHGQDTIGRALSEFYRSVHERAHEGVGGCAS